MWLGIMIGLFLFGVTALWSRTDRHGMPEITIYDMGWLSVNIGLCGAVGWLIEVML